MFPAALAAAAVAPTPEDIAYNEHSKERKKGFVATLAAAAVAPTP